MTAYTIKMLARNT